MIRKNFYIALGASALLALANQATAQVIIPQLPLNPKAKMPKLDGLQELQKQLEALQQLQPPGKPGDSAMRWGGVRLTKVDADLRAQLGLEEKEGLIVVSVDPNSAADKAGLKANDVLIKINDKSVPSDLEGFSKLLKDAKVDDAAEMVVVRKGKEETIKGAKMPAIVQGPAGGGPRRIGPGIGIAGALGGLNQRILIQQLQRNNGAAKIKNINMELADGTKIIRKQDAAKFSGEYAKDNLRITVAGKIENGKAVLGEITVTEGKETKTYKSLADTPAPQRALVQRYLLPSSPTSGFLAPAIPNLPELPQFPGIPLVPEID